MSKTSKMLGGSESLAIFFSHLILLSIVGVITVIITIRIANKKKKKNQMNTLLL
jgi:hypothetical protein